MPNTIDVRRATNSIAYSGSPAIGFLPALPEGINVSSLDYKERMMRRFRTLFTLAAAAGFALTTGVVGCQTQDPQAEHQPQFQDQPPIQQPQQNPQQPRQMPGEYQ